MQKKNHKAVPTRKDIPKSSGEHFALLHENKKIIAFPGASTAPVGKGELMEQFRNLPLSRSVETLEKG